MSVIGMALRRALEWLRRPAPTVPDRNGVVLVPLGGDIFEAEIVAAACRAAGIHVELLVSEMGQHPASAGVQQQLLVRSGDIAAVRSIRGAALPPAVE